MRPFLLLIFSLFFSNSALLAQPGAFSFLHYGTDQGLSNDRIMAILKDQQGFIWIGSVNGLNRFDGQRFQVFFHDPNDPNSLPGNYINDMTLSSNGDIWISTNMGLCRLTPATLRFERILLPEQSDTLTNDWIGKALFDKQGKLWIGAYPGVYHIDPATRKTQLFPMNRPNTGSFNSYIDSQDRLWLFDTGNLTRFDIQTKAIREYISQEPGDTLRHHTPMSVCEVDKTLWLGTWNGGLHRYDPARDTFIRVGEKSLSAKILPDTTARGEPFFWVAGGAFGLCIFDRTRELYFQLLQDPRDPFSHNNYMTSCLFKDHVSGDVWIGTEMGLEQYSPSAIRFGRVMLPTGSSQYSLVSSVVKDRTDPSGDTYYIGIWIGGIYKWNRRTNEFIKLNPKISPPPSVEVFCMMQDRQGYVWAGLNSGIIRYHPPSGSWRSFNFQKDEGIQNKILCMLEDPSGNLWFGANRAGLFRYDPTLQLIEKIPPPSDLLPAGRFYISQMTADSTGRIWMGAHGGIYVYEPSNGKFWQPKPKGLPDQYSASGVTTAKNGKIWVATDSYLLELDAQGNAERSFSKETGHLRCGRMYHLIVDRQGNIWFNSDHLLHRLDPAAETFDYFGKADGLFSNAPTDALSLAHDGEIFVGFQDALNFFHTERVRRNNIPPPVAITSLRVLNKEHSLDSFLVLKPGENMLSIGFAALNFSQPERNRYAYKLEGFDEDWILTAHPEATYTNLNGGYYTFRVKAANNDGIWNETGAVLHLKVIPPLLQRWYVRLLLACLLAGLLWAVLWYRHRQRQRLESFRESLARDLHDEMGSTLSSIRFFSEFASQQIGQDKPGVSPVLSRIGESASSLSESLQDIIWAMKAKNDRFDDLVTRMMEFGLRVLEARNIRFQTLLMEEFKGARLSPECRRNVWLIFKEALNNAAKYSGATEVTLELSLKKGNLSMSVADNGTGFDASAASRGNGLQNMRLRAEAIGGTLHVDSAIGRGTRVEFLLKF